MINIMLPFLVLLSLPLILILYFQKSNTRSPNPPGPAGLPFIGNLLQFDAQCPHTYLYKLSRKYGPLMSMKLGSRPLLVISSSKVVKEIMKSHDITFAGRPAMVSQQKLSYNGLDIAFSSYNDTWKEMRRISNLLILSSKHVQSFRPIRENEVSRMIQKIADDASQSKVINLSEAMMAFTCNLICMVTFGKSYMDDERDKRRFFELFHDIQGIFGGFFVRDYLPSLGWIDKVSGINARLEKIFSALDCFCEELIEDQLDSGRPMSMQGDILDLLLGIKRDGASSIDLTMDHIKAFIMNIVVGGTDAPSAVIVWAMTVLMKNPTIRKKAQAEIRHLGEKKDLIDENDIARLPYLRAIIKETFRLYPPAPLLIPRETMAKCTINGYEIQPKTLVYINAWAISRDEEFWKDPNDFVPERFLDSDVDLKGHNPEVIPFGIGRRGCPGMPMGMATVELGLANLLYAFDWELPNGMKEDDVDFDALPGVTMHKKNALCVMAKNVYV